MHVSNPTPPLVSPGGALTQRYRDVFSLSIVVAAVTEITSCQSQTVREDVWI